MLRRLAGASLVAGRPALHFSQPSGLTMPPGDPTSPGAILESAQSKSPAGDAGGGPSGDHQRLSWFAVSLPERRIRAKVRVGPTGS